MYLVSWNVNGIRAAVKKEFIAKIGSELNSPDVICLQETKAQDDQVSEALHGLEGYHVYSNSAIKKGYSGVALLTKSAPIEVSYGLGIEDHDTEGRVLTAEFESYYVVTVYTPNSQNELKRLPYRKEWDEAFKEHMLQLEAKKPVIVCGDLNVAHQEIDIARPKPNYNKSPGYTQTEIDGLSAILEAGYVDTFRHLNPDEVKYSWWSFRGQARAKNVGWRLDYFILSKQLLSNLSNATILNEVEGSDHCPVGLEVSL
ncbi:MAG: exodeoxyribonuclease III [Flavobacteriales bacterium]|nr:exodeoxyribonuclease III [Flavobacteriales bacterium]